MKIGCSQLNMALWLHEPLGTFWKSFGVKTIAFNPNNENPLNLYTRVSPFLLFSMASNTAKLIT